MGRYQVDKDPSCLGFTNTVDFKNVIIVKFNISKYIKRVEKICIYQVSVLRSSHIQFFFQRENWAPPSILLNYCLMKPCLNALPEIFPRPWQKVGDHQGACLSEHCHSFLSILASKSNYQLYWYKGYEIHPKERQLNAKDVESHFTTSHWGKQGCSNISRHSAFL